MVVKELAVTPRQLCVYKKQNVLLKCQKFCSAADYAVQDHVKSANKDERKFRIQRDGKQYLVWDLEVSLFLLKFAVASLLSRVHWSIV